MLNTANCNCVYTKDRECGIIRSTCRQTDRQTYRQKDRQTDRQTNRQRDLQTK